MVQVTAKWFVVMASAVTVTLLVGIVTVEYQNDHKVLNLLGVTSVPDVHRGVCSLDIFREYINKRDFFPTEGRWSTVKKNEVFTPEECSFQTNLSRDYVKDCLEKMNMKKLLLLGDSNGKMYYRSLVKMIEASGFVCQMLKEEGGDTGKGAKAYFTNGTAIDGNVIVEQARGCRTCKSELKRCTESGVNSNATHMVILVEFIIMEFYLDVEVTTYRTKTKGTCPKPPEKCTQSNSYQEFIFMEYLKENQPDLVYIFANSHSIRAKQLFQITPSMSMLASVVNNTMPRATPVVWVSGVGEYDPKKPKFWQKARFGPQRVPAQEMVTIINQALFDTLKPILRAAGSNSFAFLDLQSVSNGVLQKWSEDGIHMRMSWYERIMPYLLQSVCNSQAVARMRQ